MFGYGVQPGLNFAFSNNLSEAADLSPKRGGRRTCPTSAAIRGEAQRGIMIGCRHSKKNRLAGRWIQVLNNGNPMNSAQRPLPVLIVAWIYVAVGVIGFAYHFPELMAHRQDSVWVELTELLAVVSGAFMLRGRNWARWLALAWIAFHVIISISVVREFVMHLLILVLIFWALWRPGATRYFLSGTNLPKNGN